ncbi:hypothetical protein BD410DRAFT_902258, partial [Rickenella mellea]
MSRQKANMCTRYTHHKPSLICLRLISPLLLSAWSAISHSLAVKNSPISPPEQ